MENRLHSDLTNRIAEGIKRGIEKMIDYKIRNGQSIVISSKPGEIRIISGPELEQYRKVEIIVGNPRKTT